MSFSKFPHYHRLSRAIYPVILIPLLALILISGSLAVYFTNFAHAAPADTLVPIAGDVPTMVTGSKLVGPASAQQQLSLSVELRLRNSAMLAKYVQDMSLPKSVNYHRYLSQAQLAAVFSPAQATQNALLSYLQNAGFTITQTYNHRLLIDFSGTVGLAEQVFHVQINNYLSARGESFFANATNPLLPSSLAAAVQLISGLSNAQRWNHPPLPVSPHPVSSKAMISKGSALFCPGPVNQGTYFTPGQIQTAYNLSGLYGTNDRGEGQTVALFELDTFQMSDLTNYESCYDYHTRTHIYTTLVDGGPPPPQTGDGGPVEVELDAEQVLSAAPALGQLDIYEAPNTTQGYNDEWAKIVQNDPPVVSTSWGECESDLGLAEAQVENSDFLFAAAQGETVYAASGDTGSSGCIRSGGSTSLSAGDPAAQPYVTGVGGTSLTLNNSSQYSSETVWNDPPVTGYAGGASGGGISQFWTENPAWISAPGVQNQYSTRTTCSASVGQICREEPDVSLNADPYVGYLVYCTVSQAGCSSSTPWLIVGGTSAAAPLWAAMTALANEQSLKQGGFNMGWITPLLYDVASNRTQYANDFHDITSGNSDYNGYQGGRYPATSGFDMATGLGSFNAANLTTDMISYNGQRAATPANTQWYFAEGSVGGGFAEYLTLQNPSTSQNATVTVTYELQNHTPAIVTKQYTVFAGTRYTVYVNNDLGLRPSGAKVSMAASVSSTIPIVAERPMYFSFHGVSSGTDVLGATSLHTTYYFPYGNTTQSGSTNDSTYLTMLNPSTTTTANVTITYYTGSCSTTCLTEPLTLGPQARGTASPTDVGLHGPVAIAVSSSLPIVVERPMYVNANIPNAGGQTTGAASVVGATSPGTDWLFAEGTTQPGFQEYLNLANFGATAATATIKLEYTNGDVQTVTQTVPADGFVPFDVNNANAHPGSCTPSPCSVTSSLSAEVTAAQPIVVDRLMYFHYHGNIPGITEVVGTPAAHNIYAFAEGYTGGAFSEYLTLQNPTASNETVAVTLFTGHGLILQQEVIVAAHSRSTVTINNVLNPIGSDSVSMVVQALGNGALIVAERPQYFSYGIQGTKYTALGATDVIGYTG